MPKIDTVKPGDTLPEREFNCNNVQLFLYNAALWNAHRIHFDHPYATDVEGYPGLVVAGPLMGDWLTQCVIDWLGEDGSLASYEYSNRKAAYTGDTLRASGRVVSVDKENGEVKLELYLKDAADEVVVPGEALAKLAPV